MSMRVELMKHADEMVQAFAVGLLLAGKVDDFPSADDINEFLTIMNTRDEVSDNPEEDYFADQFLTLASVLAAIRILTIFAKANPNSKPLSDKVTIQYPENLSEEISVKVMSTLTVLFNNWTPSMVAVNDDLTGVIITVEPRKKF